MNVAKSFTIARTRLQCKYHNFGELIVKKVHIQGHYLTRKPTAKKSETFYSLNALVVLACCMLCIVKRLIAVVAPAVNRRSAVAIATNINYRHQ